MVVYCRLHHPVVADKYSHTKLRAVLSPAKSMINFLGESFLNHRCLCSVSFEEIVPKHMPLYFHTGAQQPFHVQGAYFISEKCKNICVIFFTSKIIGVPDLHIHICASFKEFVTVFTLQKQIPVLRN